MCEKGHLQAAFVWRKTNRMANALIFLDIRIQLSYTLFHIFVKGVKRMNDITTLCIRIPREDKLRLMEYA